MLPRGPLSGQGFLAPNRQCTRLDPELKATLKGAGDLGLRVQGIFWILGSSASWQRSTPSAYIREVRETEADTGGSSGKY